MKRLITVFAVLVFICMDVFAFVDYLAPMASTGGIPMNPIQIRDGSGKLTKGAYTPVVVKPGIDSFAAKSKLPEELDAGYYTDREMIATGGVKEITGKRCRDTSLQINATCPNGFYFVSQSNPSYKRPFQLYIVPKAYRIGWTSRESPDAYGQPLILDDAHQSYSFTYVELATEEYSWQTSTRLAHQLWFDLVLVLPGKVENNILKWPGHGEFPLIEEDDYSAVVTIDMQATVQGKVQPVKTISIPFTGYYTETEGDKRDEYVSLYINSTASAGNIDMRNYSRQQVADIEVMTVKDANASRTDGFGILISNSPDPFEPAGPFKFVKENLQYDDVESIYNSVGFDIILQDNKTPSNTKQFDGTGSISRNSISGSDKSTIPSNLMLPAASKVMENTHASKYDYWYFSGSVFVQIHDNSTVTMESGRYTSTVYIHVIGFD